MEDRNIFQFSQLDPIRNSNDQSEFLIMHDRWDPRDSSSDSEEEYLPVNLIWSTRVSSIVTIDVSSIVSSQSCLIQTTE